MSTELLLPKLAFRGLSDEDPDEITIDSPDDDGEKEDDEDDVAGDDTDTSGTGEPLE